jgi:hypothetical protein
VKKNIGTLLQVLLEENHHEQLPAVLAALGVREWFYYEKLLAQKCPAVLEKHFDLPVWNWLDGKHPALLSRIYSVTPTARAHVSVKPAFSPHYNSCARCTRAANRCRL